MKSYYYIVSVCLIILTACKSQKEVVTQSDLDTLNSLVTNKQFVIESNWAHPQVTMAMQQVLNAGLLQAGNNAGSISLIGNPNFLKVSGDSISSHLPYFGERQMQVAYGGGDSTIEFNGLMKHYKVKQEKDQSYAISFEAKSNSETFNVYIKLFPNGNSEIMLNGMSRLSIRYTGEAKPLKPSE